MANHVAKTSDQDDDNDDVKSSDCNGSGDGKDQENDPGVSNHMITQPVDSCDFSIPPASWACRLMMPYRYSSSNKRS